MKTSNTQCFIHTNNNIFFRTVLVISLPLILGLSACDNADKTTLTQSETQPETQPKAVEQLPDKAKVVNDTSANSLDNTSDATTTTPIAKPQADNMAVNKNHLNESDVNTEKSDESMNQAKSFTNIYSTTCMKYMHNLDQLSAKLKGLSSFPPEQAQKFLQGQSGTAYPVPDKYGTYVLAVMNSNKMCAVYAKNANTDKVIEDFHSIFSSAPSPLKVNKKAEDTVVSKTNIAYEWYAEGASKKMLFMLTTDSSDNAEVQALFTSSVITE